MRRRQIQNQIILSESDRLTMIEWLSLITNLPKSHWEQQDDYHIKKLYEANVEEHGYEVIGI